ncbi:hypothetical protein GGF43_003713, partial [Coemansia sp. RSA 2618]
ALGAMDVHLVSQLCVCERHLGRVDACLAHVLSLLANAQYLDAESQEAYARMLVELAHEVREEQTLASSPLFRVSGVAVDGREDTVAVGVDVWSGVPWALDALRVEAVLVAGGDGGGEQLEIVLDAGGVALRPGDNHVTLTSDSVSCPGRFEVRSVHVFVGRVEFRVAVSNPNARRFVRLNPHPLGPVIELRAGSSSLTVAVTPGTAIDAGMRIWLRDADGRAVLDEQCVAPAGYAIEEGALVVAGAFAGCVEACVELKRQPASGEATAYAEYEVEGDPRMVLDSDVVEFAPPLQLSALAEDSIESSDGAADGPAHAGSRILQLRAQCCALAPVCVRALAFAGADVANADPAQLEARGFLQFAESTTVVRAVPRGVESVAVRVRYSTLYDVVRACVCARVARAAEEHGLRLHARYLQRVVLAHVRRTLDVGATLRESRLVREPAAGLWRQCADGGAAGVRAALRRALGALALGGMRLALDAGAGREMHVTLGVQPRRAAYVTVSAPAFCSVYAAAALAVRVRARGRVRVTLEPGACMVAGAVRQDVDGGADLAFTVVPLAAGYLALPEVVCHECTAGEGGEKWTRLHTVLSASPSSLRVLQNEGIPLCSVPVVR